MLWAIKTYAPITDRILEIGTGTGYVLQGMQATFSASEIWGIDRIVEPLQYIHSSSPDAYLLCGDVSRLPFNSVFDVVGAFDIIEHIFHDEEALQQIHNALKPGGIMVLTVPQHRWLWSKSDEHSGIFGGHHRRYTRRELVHKVKQSSFEVLRVTSFATFLLPIIAFSRLLMQRTHYVPGTEFNIPRPLNIIFEKIMQFEHYIIRQGTNLPCGGSLLLVARKRAS